MIIEFRKWFITMFRNPQVGLVCLSMACEPRNEAITKWGDPPSTLQKTTVTYPIIQGFGMPEDHGLKSNGKEEKDIRYPHLTVPYIFGTRGSIVT